MSKLIDLAGQRFSRLLVIERVHDPRRVYWACICDCGSTSTVSTENLRCGKTVSCGCRMREAAAEQVKRNTTHGHATNGTTRTLHIWNGMRARCTNPNSQFYKDYGGRGITFCDSWYLFANFLADMGECPPGLTLDRIDNNGNYELGNCRWATRKMQANNRRPRSVQNRNAFRLEYMGQVKTIKDWSAEVGIPANTLHARMNFFGWSIARALETPLHARTRHPE